MGCLIAVRPYNIFNQEKALLGAFTVITNLQMDIRFKLYTKVSSLESTMATLQPEVTSNTEKITKVNNCFADINSADCPSARYRTGKSAEQHSVGEEELDTAASRSSYLDDVGQYDNDDGFELDPSSLLRSIFRFRRDTSSRRKKNKSKKKAAAAGVSAVSARSTTPLVPQLRILLACMADSAASTCTAQYR